MYGNRNGWVLSGLLVLAFAAAIYGFEAAKAVSAPTGEFGAAAMGPLKFDVPPRSVVPAEQPGDAGPPYRKAIAAYHQDDLTYDRLARNDRSDDPPTDPAALRALAPLMEATPLQSMNLFAANPAEVVGYQSDPPALAALLQVGRAAAFVGALRQKDHPDEARRLFEAVFALGANLVAERVTYAELQGGLEMLSLGDAGLASAAAKQRDFKLRDAVEAFEPARKSLYDQRIAPAWRAISSIDPAVRNKYAGDVFAFAGGAGERVWQVESLLKLGRLRFSAARLGDKSGANRVLKREATDATDPAVKLAAEKGRDLTLREFHLLK